MLPGNQVVLHHNSHDQKLLRTRLRKITSTCLLMELGEEFS
jgi:hypothetical protein